MEERSRFISHIVDDGWNLPYEVVEEIKLRIARAYESAFQRVCQENYRHKGDWLTKDVADFYSKKGSILLLIEGGQNVRTVRQTVNELIEKYGVTEVEALNILKGCHVNEYISKYDRIRRMIPMSVDEDRIMRQVRFEYAC